MTRLSLHLVPGENFWKTYIFRKDIYENDYDSYFFLTCSAKKNPNWESICGSVKRSLRYELNKWWEEGTFGLDEKEEKLTVKEHLDMYHIFTGFEQRGVTQINYLDEECLAWIVGVKFKEIPDQPLKEEQRKRIMQSFELQNNAHVQIYFEMSNEGIEER
jgi:hypothetical protein